MVGGEVSYTLVFVPFVGPGVCKTPGCEVVYGASMNFNYVTLLWDLKIIYWIIDNLYRHLVFVLGRPGQILVHKVTFLCVDPFLHLVRYHFIFCLTDN